MKKHTNGPWVVSGYRVAPEGKKLNGGFYIACCHGKDKIKNIKRIVSCVNACDGMNDPVVYIRQLIQERDELLASLEATVKAWEVGFDIVGGMIKAKAVIAKAKGIDHE